MPLALAWQQVFAFEPHIVQQASELASPETRNVKVNVFHPHVNKRGIAEHRIAKDRAGEVALIENTTFVPTSKVSKGPVRKITANELTVYERISVVVKISKISLPEDAALENAAFDPHTMRIKMRKIAITELLMH
jgi:hypothetical protein